MDIKELQAGAAPGHTCTQKCVDLSNEDHDFCSALPEKDWCDDCKQFTSDHPGI
jgi:hypothetical protein